MVNASVKDYLLIHLNVNYMLLSGKKLEKQSICTYLECYVPKYTHRLLGFDYIKGYFTSVSYV